MHTLILTALTIAVAEMGDKTQLMVVALSSRFKLRDVILGIVGAVIVLNLIAVAVGAALSSVIPLEWVRLLAGLSFLGFALWSLRPPCCDDDDRCSDRRCLPAFVTVGITFFLAELGDKTQLYSVSMAAANPDEALYVFIGATVGLLCADAISIGVGLLLGKSLPENTMRRISFAIFTVFGFLTVYEPLPALAGGAAPAIMAAVGAVFAGGCLLVKIRCALGERRAER